MKKERKQPEDIPLQAGSSKPVLTSEAKLSITLLWDFIGRTVQEAGTSVRNNSIVKNCVKEIKIQKSTMHFIYLVEWYKRSRKWSGQEKRKNVFISKPVNSYFILIKQGRVNLFSPVF